MFWFHIMQSMRTIFMFLIYKYKLSFGKNILQGKSTANVGTEYGKNGTYLKTTIG